MTSEITFIFFPSSSILYSVTVFIFPLMVSLGDGRVPVKHKRIFNNSNSRWYLYYWHMINYILNRDAPNSMQYTQQKCILLKANYFLSWTKVRKTTGLVQTLRAPDAACATFRARSKYRQCFHWRKSQLKVVSLSKVAQIFETIRHLNGWMFNRETDKHVEPASATYSCYAT